MAARDYRKTLGAGLPSGTTQILIFIPDRDRDKKPINQRQWCDMALETLGRLFRGATAFPPGKGVWRDDDRGGALLFESVVMVVSYVSPRFLTAGALDELRHFLHKFGKEANQGEVGVIIGGTYYGISHYDKT